MWWIVRESRKYGRVVIAYKYKPYLIDKNAESTNFCCRILSKLGIKDLQWYLPYKAIHGSIDTVMIGLNEEYFKNNSSIDTEPMYKRFLRREWFLDDDEYLKSVEEEQKYVVE